MLMKTVMLIGEAPLVDGAVPFAPGTATRDLIVEFLGVADAELETCAVLRNALPVAQPRRGWGRAFDYPGARQGIARLLATEDCGQVLLLGGRVAEAARGALPHLPLQRGRWGCDKAGRQAAWVRHPAYKGVPLAELSREWRALGMAA